MRDGFDELLSVFKASPDAMTRATLQKSRKLAEKVAGRARNGAPVRYGRLRNSIVSYTESHGDQIEGGARTDYLPAIYHEFGTGPVGEASGYPAQISIDYRPDGWTYQSADVAAQRGEEYVPNEKGGYVYTEGVPARAFMYNAITSMEGEITAVLGDVVTEVFVDK